MAKHIISKHLSYFLTKQPPSYYPFNAFLFDDKKKKSNPCLFIFKQYNGSSIHSYGHPNEQHRA